MLQQHMLCTVRKESASSDFPVHFDGGQGNAAQQPRLILVCSMMDASGVPLEGLT